MEARLKVELAGVPETLLWTLYHRAQEAQRPNPVLNDPKAVELTARIDYPFAERFGESAVLAQWQALRARRFDEEITRFLAKNPDGTVVALGEGLETQFWRVDNGRVHWVTVDLPEAIDVRERLLPHGDRQTVIAASALDPRWMAEVDDARGVLITAQGLLMYLEFDEVRQLLRACTERFPKSPLVFDAVRGWLAGERKTRSDGRYQAPPWLWGLDKAHEHQLEAVVADLQLLRIPRGRGILFGYVVPLLRRLGPITIVRARL